MKPLLTEGHQPLHYELHVYRGLREQYRIEDNLFATNGRLVFTEFAAVRKLSFRMNAGRDPKSHIYPGELYAAGLLHETGHAVLRKFEQRHGGEVFVRAIEYLAEQLGKPALHALMLRFTEKFPPLRVYRGEMSPAHYLAGQTKGIPRLALAIEEALMLALANENPGCAKLRPLFDLEYLGQTRDFFAFMQAMEAFFKTLPPFGPDNTDMITMLRSPFVHSPDDLNGQLDYVFGKWKDYLPEEILTRVLTGKDLMKEDVRLDRGFGPPPPISPVYKGKPGPGRMHIGKSGFDPLSEAADDYEEPEQFTPDTHWMPRVVLMAKNTYVWLDQLSKKYSREIRHLDQIPDEELDQLAQWHFSGLWLIGIWERSQASKKIKHRMGNTDAVSSAYSLYDYQIADDLGGERAYHKLNERARQRGLRLASDMVPNHTGIYSKWVVEKPGYFIQTGQPPFPGYTFSGEDLSGHPGIEIRIEDGYYSKTDAAVVFQRIDRNSGEVRYIYHGNDGTVMPWNDTAQLDMIRQEVREAVIQQIFSVARKFSIIRFDAAMTLAKKHFARLWYPRPGTGGDIPSRADHSMSRAAFDAMFPEEFWREVVDRINRDMPDTLLLAEAFWFMEGYFVRTLGMHRVYNSAFMHMLKNEENVQYRDLITNTLEFEPEILKRYVNFMSNPDEETAIEQFGTGDKYFGICVMMNTLPGLPMFAHGQIEGFTEKYGMEYQRAYYNETPRQELVERHEREIFPLTGKRYLFSEVTHFNLFDFTDETGKVNENVFAYTNRCGEEKALILFNNKYDRASGHIRMSAPRLQKGEGGGGTVSVSLGDALQVRPDRQAYYTAMEHISGLEYLFKGSELHDRGLHWKLQGFEYRVLTGFAGLSADPDQAELLYERLELRGVESVKEALQKQRLEKIHEEFLRIFDPAGVDRLLELHLRPGIAGDGAETLHSITASFTGFAREAYGELGMTGDSKEAGNAFHQQLSALPQALHFLGHSVKWAGPLLAGENIHSPGELTVLSPGSPQRENTLLLMAFYVIRSLGQLSPTGHKASGLYQQLMLRWPVESVLRQTGKSSADLADDLLLLELLLHYEKHPYSTTELPTQPLPDTEPGKTAAVLSRQVILARQMLSDPRVRKYIGLNHYQGIRYYSKEKLEQLSRWLFSLACFECFRSRPKPPGEAVLRQCIRQLIQLFLKTKKLSDNAAYRLDTLSGSLHDKKAP